MTTNSTYLIPTYKLGDTRALDLHHSHLSAIAQDHLLSAFWCSMTDHSFFAYVIEDLVRILQQQPPVAASLVTNGNRALFMSAWFAEVIKARNLSPAYYLGVARTSFALAAHYDRYGSQAYYHAIDRELFSMYETLCAVRPAH